MISNLSKIWLHTSSAYFGRLFSRYKNDKYYAADKLFGAYLRAVYKVDIAY